MAKNSENSSNFGRKSAEEPPEHDYHEPATRGNNLEPHEIADGGAHLDVDLSELRWSRPSR